MAFARSTLARAARTLASTAPRPASRPALFQCAHAARASRRLLSVSAALREKKYTQDHEWVEVSADKKSFTLGISHYAASALGDVVYVELPQTDTSYGAHDAIGAVESVKSASDIMTPLAGTVVAVNTGLEAAPSTINKDPEGEGWIAKIDLEDPTALEGEGLLSKEEYRKLTEE